MRLFRDSRQPARNLVHPSEEDVLMQLVHYDVVILMDDSWSMSGKRWEQAGKVMRGVVKQAIKYDRDGIEIQFLNDPNVSTLKSEEEVVSLFSKVSPRSTTPLGRRLSELCNKYLHDLEREKPNLKRCLIIAITDGVPDDKAGVYTAVRETAQRLDQLGAPLAQFGIQFVQIGKDWEASMFLAQLDDNLKGDQDGQVGRDIVDTVPHTGADLTSKELVKILVGAINRKVDNQTKIS